MSVAAPVPVDEYLNTTYDPDVDFVDGVLVERKMGVYLHSRVQSNIIFTLRSKYPRLEVLPEMRSKITSTRFRVSDVTVLYSPPETRFLDEPANIAIEILSEGDDMSRMVEKLDEYAAKGVPDIWVMDPRRRTLHVSWKSASRIG